MISLKKDTLRTFISWYFYICNPIQLQSEGEIDMTNIDPKKEDPNTTIKPGIKGLQRVMQKLMLCLENGIMKLK